MSLPHDTRRQVMLVEELKVKSASSMSDINEIGETVMKNEVECIFESSEGVKKKPFYILMLNFTPIHFLNICLAG